jgi:hypothetical protein
MGNSFSKLACKKITDYVCVVTSPKVRHTHDLAGRLWAGKKEYRIEKFILQLTYLLSHHSI